MMRMVRQVCDTSSLDDAKTPKTKEKAIQLQKPCLLRDDATCLVAVEVAAATAAASTTSNTFQARDCAFLRFGVRHDAQTDVQWSTHPVVMPDGSAYIVENWSRALASGQHVWVRMWFEYHADEQETDQEMRQLEVSFTFKQGSKVSMKLVVHCAQQYGQHGGGATQSAWVDFNKYAVGEHGDNEDREQIVQMVALLERAVIQRAVQGTEVVNTLGWQERPGTPLTDLLSRMTHSDSFIYNCARFAVSYEREDDVSHFVPVVEASWFFTTGKSHAHYSVKSWDHAVMMVRYEHGSHDTHTSWFVHADNTNKRAASRNESAAPPRQTATAPPAPIGVPLFNLCTGADWVHKLLLYPGNPKHFQQEEEQLLPTEWQLLSQTVETFARVRHWAWKEVASANDDGVAGQVARNDPLLVLHVEGARSARGVAAAANNGDGDCDDDDDNNDYVTVPFDMDVWEEEAPGAVNGESLRLCQAAEVYRIPSLCIPWYVLQHSSVAAMQWLFPLDAFCDRPTPHAFQTCRLGAKEQWLIAPMMTGENITTPIAVIRYSSTWKGELAVMSWPIANHLQLRIADYTNKKSTYLTMVLLQNKRPLARLRVVNNQMQLARFDALARAWISTPPVDVSWARKMSPEATDVGRSGIVMNRYLQSMRKSNLFSDSAAVGAMQGSVARSWTDPQGQLFVSLLFGVVPPDDLLLPVTSSNFKTISFIPLQTAHMAHWPEDTVLRIPRQVLSAIIQDLPIGHTVIRVRSSKARPDHVLKTEADTFLAETDEEYNSATIAGRPAWHLLKQELNEHTRALNQYVVTYNGREPRKKRDDDPTTTIGPAPVDGSGSSKPSAASKAKETPVSFAQHTQHQGYGSMAMRAQVGGGGGDGKEGDAQLTVAVADATGKLQAAQRLIYKVLLCLHPVSGQLLPCIACLDISKSDKVAFHGANEKLRGESATVRWIRTIVEHPRPSSSAARFAGSRWSSPESRWFSYERDMKLETCAVCTERMAGALFPCGHSMCHQCYAHANLNRAAAADVFRCHLCRVPVVSVQDILPPAYQHPEAAATATAATATAMQAPHAEASPHAAASSISIRIDCQASQHYQQQHDDACEGDEERQALLAPPSTTHAQTDSDAAEEPILLSLRSEEKQQQQQKPPPPPPLASAVDDVGEVRFAISFVHRGATMIYETGRTYFIDDFDSDLARPCSKGLHGFLSDTAPQMRRWIRSDFARASDELKARWRQTLEQHAAA